MKRRSFAVLMALVMALSGIASSALADEDVASLEQCRLTYFKPELSQNIIYMEDCSYEFLDVTGISDSAFYNHTERVDEYEYVALSCSKGSHKLTVITGEGFGNTKRKWDIYIDFEDTETMNMYRRVLLTIIHRSYADNVLLDGGLIENGSNSSCSVDCGKPINFSISASSSKNGNVRSAHSVSFNIANGSQQYISAEVSAVSEGEGFHRLTITPLKATPAGQPAIVTLKVRPESDAPEISHNIAVTVTSDQRIGELELTGSSAEVWDAEELTFEAKAYYTDGQARVPAGSDVLDALTWYVNANEIVWDEQGEYRLTGEGGYASTVKRCDGGIIAISKSENACSPYTGDIEIKVADSASGKLAKAYARVGDRLADPQIECARQDAIAVSPGDKIDLSPLMDVYDCVSSDGSTVRHARGNAAGLGFATGYELSQSETELMSVDEEGNLVINPAGQIEAMNGYARPLKLRVDITIPASKLESAEERTLSADVNLIIERPTTEPTATDTAEPIATDTAKPTATDTAEPTATDTAEPTVTDTAKPTATDTTEPTATDTAKPTATDTAEPTATDTAEPTATDTTEPTATDTAEPTATDTAEPTVTDTAEPTVTDTAKPTATDTAEPTATDTAEPTVTDTAKPTATDTAKPTATDTAEPTATDTAEPTATDTTEPTATDTAKPTATDTAEPTATDTAEPTVTDTAKPTATDTTEPTATDTAEPTATDTAEPTVTDTAKPTATDTAEPTVTDTAKPTATDTAEPTVTDTAKPTATDTAEPTATDTAEPAVTDTAKPTAPQTAKPKPTAKPTLKPTATPAVRPTAEPTAAPTAEPTVMPTAAPTAEPTLHPTTEPTAMPSAEPTARPVAKGKVATRSSALNVRTGPGMSYDKSGSLPRNAAVTILEDSGEWLLVTAGRLTGYVSAQYIERLDVHDFDTEQPGYMTGFVSTGGKSLRVRRDASFSAQVTKVISNGDALIILEAGSEWTRIDHNGHRGYVATRYITINDR